MPTASALVEQMTTSPYAEVRRAACEHLKALAFDDANVQVLCDAGAVEALVSVLIPTSPLVQLAADAVWSLSAHCTSRICAVGAVPLLARLLSAKHSPSLMATAAATLHQVLEGTCAEDLWVSDVRGDELPAVEPGVPLEVSSELVAVGGIDNLMRVLLEAEAAGDIGEAAQSVTATLAILAVDPTVSDSIASHEGGISCLVSLLRWGARAGVSRHAAAILARMARDSPAHQAAIREAGGVEELVSLCEDALKVWAVSESDAQAAQHAAGALWLLAQEHKSRDEILDRPNALKALASMLNGRLGAKAEGNAAGALLALVGSAEAHNDLVDGLCIVGESVSMHAPAA